RHVAEYRPESPEDQLFQLRRVLQWEIGGQQAAGCQALAGLLVELPGQQHHRASAPDRRGRVDGDQVIPLVGQADIVATVVDGDLAERTVQVLTGVRVEPRHHRRLGRVQID